jgi:hypothetical protein
MEMDHNNFDFYDDLTQPLMEFMIKLKFLPNVDHALGTLNYLKFDPRVYEIPEEYRESSIGDKINEEPLMRKLMATMGS